MRVILSVELSGLYLRTLGLSDQVAVVHDGDRLVDVSHAAQKRKVTLERSLREAKLLLQGDGVYAPYRSEEFEEAAARWFDLLATFSSTVEPVSPARALVDLSDHPHPLNVAALVLAALHKQERLPIRAGIGHSPWLALLAAYFCDARALELGLLPVEPVENPAQFLAGKPITCLTPLPTEVRQRLDRLGLRTVRDVQTIPQAALVQQFHARTTWIQAVAMGNHCQPVALAWPPLSVTVGLKLGRCENREVLDLALERLSKQAAGKLCARDRLASGLGVSVMFESGVVQNGDRHFKHPVQTALPLLTHLRQVVEGFTIDEPVYQIQLRLLKLSESQRRQPALSFGARRDTSGAETVVNRLQRALGSTAVVVASSLKQSREKQVLKAWREAYGWV